MKKTKMTLGVKLGITMAALLIATIVIGFFINNTFLEKYYLFNKQKQMVAAYESIDIASEKGILTEAKYDIPFSRMCSNYNLNMLVLVPYTNQIIRSSVSDEHLQQQYERLVQDEKNGKYTVIRKTQSYDLALQTDEAMNEEFLVLAGFLSDNNYIYMRTPIQSIRESAAITNYFLRLIGLGSILVGIIVIFLLARSITRPVKKLTEISDKVSQLDFQAKYDGRGGSREIDELGEHINQMSATLEQTISELKSANIQLKNDIQQKEQIDDMRKEFLSNVSHELKTPIALIQGYAEGLVEGIGEDPESRNFYCEVIMDEANKMNKMVKNLLSLNQLEFGNDKIEMEHFDLIEVVKGVVNASSLMCEQKEIKVFLEQKEPVYVWADEFKIEQVITNYLSNAINHADGDKRITIRVDRSNDKVKLSVFNTGLQIPEADLDKIWDKFYKVDKARTREYGGNGIGLSIVKAIMESMNQGYGVQNHEDGVEFWIEIDAKSLQML